MATVDIQQKINRLSTTRTRVPRLREEKESARKTKPRNENNVQYFIIYRFLVKHEQYPITNNLHPFIQISAITYCCAGILTIANFSKIKVLTFRWDGLLLQQSKYPRTYQIVQTRFT